ncbi:uncharacterized protein LOC131655699 [Vicia villosa]|uniref:uncharacterized protein LOC131613091 n=1 Tax=Vicia villosa TaxID=3911 RepID=UPI00273AFA04|nr:uncharacterized protein LOC131613091 [Vicia villosa]XP_058740799.1 uncharacterized protein LOC131613100 [Vicia villosa]XP_058781506.1 uncharacterized protein LOC131655699 [Vicia villosa]
MKSMNTISPSNQGTQTEQKNKMNSSTICSVFLGLILISQYPLAANARSIRGTLISIVCRESSNKAECNNILKSIPQATHVKNFHGLAKAVLEMAIYKAAAGQSFLKTLAASTNSPALTKCANNDYDNVVMSFKSSLGELEEDYGTSSYDAKIAGDGSDQCESAMVAANDVNPQVTALNHQISFYSELAFLVTRNL